jgi:hypothetical protein
VEACSAIVSHVGSCRLSSRERLQALAEVRALSHRELFKKSRSVRDATDQAALALDAASGHGPADDAGADP